MKWSRVHSLIPKIMAGHGLRWYTYTIKSKFPSKKVVPWVLCTGNNAHDVFSTTPQHVRCHRTKLARDRAKSRAITCLGLVYYVSLGKTNDSLCLFSDLCREIA